MRKLNILITTLILLAVMPLIFAQTMTAPVANGNYTKSLTVTVTVTSNGANNMTNVTCYYNSSGGAATTQFLQILNDSLATTTFTGVGTLTTEAITYNISCKIQNGTTLNSTVSAAGITIDGTNPACSIKIKSPKIPYKGIQDVTWTSTDSLSLVSTLVTIDRPQSGADMTYTDANRVLTLLSTDTNYWGDWTATVLATDRSSNTCTTSATFKSYLPDGEIEEAYAQEEEAGANLKGWLIVIIIGVVAYLIFKDK